MPRQGAARLVGPNDVPRTNRLRGALASRADHATERTTGRARVGSCLSRKLRLPVCQRAAGALRTSAGPSEGRGVAATLHFKASDPTTDRRVLRRLWERVFQTVRDGRIPRVWPLRGRARASASGVRWARRVPPTLRTWWHLMRQAMKPAWWTGFRGGTTRRTTNPFRGTRSPWRTCFPMPTCLSGVYYPLFWLC